MQNGPWARLLGGLPPDVADLAYTILAPSFDGSAALASVYSKPLAVSSKQNVIAGSGASLNWSFDSIGVIYGISQSAPVVAPDQVNDASMFIRNDASNENVFATEDNPYDLAGIPDSVRGSAPFMRIDPTPVHSTNDFSGQITFPIAAWAANVVVSVNLIGVYFFVPGSQINT